MKADYAIKTIFSALIFVTCLSISGCKKEDQWLPSHTSSLHGTKANDDKIGTTDDGYGGVTDKDDDEDDNDGEGKGHSKNNGGSGDSGNDPEGNNGGA